MTKKNLYLRAEAEKIYQYLVAVTGIRDDWDETRLEQGIAAVSREFFKGEGYSEAQFLALEGGLAKLFSYENVARAITEATQCMSLEYQISKEAPHKDAVRVFRGYMNECVGNGIDRLQNTATELVDQEKAHLGTGKKTFDSHSIAAHLAIRAEGFFNAILEKYADERIAEEEGAPTILGVSRSY